MADAKQYPIAIVVRALDKATGPLARIADRVNHLTQPFKEAGAKWGKFSEALNLGGVGKGLLNVGGAMKNVAGEVVGLGLKLAGTAAAAGLAFGALVKSAVDAGDQLGEVAGRVGMAVDSYAALRFSAAQADVEQEAFTSGLDKLNKQLGDMTAGKGGEFLAFLNEIGPEFAKQMKAAGSTEKALVLLTDAFAKIDDPTKRATLSAHAFGKTNLQMGEWLHQGWGSISGTAERFLELSGSQERFAANAGELDNAMRESEVALLGLRNAAMGALFPALTKLSAGVTTFLVKNRDGIARWAEKTGAKIEAWVDGGGLNRLVDSFDRVATGIGTVLSVLGPTGTAFAGLAVMAGPLIASLGSLGVALVGLAIEAAPLIIAAWPAVTAAFGSFAAGFVAAAVPVAAFVAMAGSLALLGKTIYDNWDQLAFIFKDWGNSLKWAVVDAWTTVRPILEKMSGIFGGGMNPFGSAIAVGDALVPSSGGSATGLDPASARPIRTTSDARVSVAFQNTPAGTRVSSAGDAPMSVDVGYSMGP